MISSIGIDMCGLERETCSGGRCLKGPRSPHERCRHASPQSPGWPRCGCFSPTDRSTLRALFVYLDHQLAVFVVERSPKVDVCAFSFGKPVSTPDQVQGFFANALAHGCQVAPVCRTALRLASPNTDAAQTSDHRRRRGEWWGEAATNPLVSRSRIFPS